MSNNQSSDLRQKIRHPIVIQTNAATTLRTMIKAL
jgi:hypothetical protein